MTKNQLEKYTELLEVVKQYCDTYLSKKDMDNMTKDRMIGIICSIKPTAQVLIACQVAADVLNLYKLVQWGTIEHW